MCTEFHPFPGDHGLMDSDFNQWVETFDAKTYHLHAFPEACLLGLIDLRGVLTAKKTDMSEEAFQREVSKCQQRLERILEDEIEAYENRN